MKTCTAPGTAAKADIKDALVTVVLRCLKELDRIMQPTLPFKGDWISPRHQRPDMELTVLLYHCDLQEIFLGSLDLDEDGNEVWIDQYGMELDGITLWAELPYPELTTQVQA